MKIKADGVVVDPSTHVLLELHILEAVLHFLGHRLVHLGIRRWWILYHTSYLGVEDRDWVHPKDDVGMAKAFGCGPVGGRDQSWAKMRIVQR